MSESNLLSRHEVAAMLRISLRSLDTYVKDGHLPAPVSLGGRKVFFHRAIVERFINRIFGIATGGADDDQEMPSGIAEPQKRRRGRPRKLS